MNALSPIAITVSGICTSLNPIQYENALSQTTNVPSLIEYFTNSSGALSSFFPSRPYFTLYSSSQLSSQSSSVRIVDSSYSTKKEGVSGSGS
jgi:hypothetical protein